MLSLLDDHVALPLAVNFTSLPCITEAFFFIAALAVSSLATAAVVTAIVATKATATTFFEILANISNSSFFNIKMFFDFCAK